MAEESIKRLQALSPYSIGRPFVLIVDDEPRILAVAQRALSGLGYSTMTCEKPEEALAIARAVLPDLVLTDALMPKLDGRELCRLLKSDPETNGIKVVVMTATFKGTRHANEAHKEFLVDEYLEKPVRAALLGDVVRRLIGSPAETPARISA